MGTGRAYPAEELVATGIASIALLLPVPNRRQIAWAGPRLVQLAACSRAVTEKPQRCGDASNRARRVPARAGEWRRCTIADHATGSGRSTRGK